jgi:hypothetical protein
MKLKKQDLIKQILDDGTALYEYTCKKEEDGQEVVNRFYIRASGAGATRNIFVYKNSEFYDNFQNIYSTNDNIQAWNKFEELLEECAPKQDSSGGFMKNPQNNPNVLPLLAFTDIQRIWDVSFFVMLDTGEQAVVDRFTIPINNFPAAPNDDVFSVDWSNVNDIPDLFKCEVIFKKFEKAKFEESPQASVFLFIPKNIMQQNDDVDDEGKEQGKVEKGKKELKKTTPKPEIQKPMPPEGPEPPETPEGPEGPENPQPPEGPQGPTGKPTDKKSDKKGKPSDEKPTDEKPTDEKGDDERKLEPNEREDQDKLKSTYLLKGLSTQLNMGEDLVASFFTRVGMGETFLLSNNFDELKKSLNLPADLTARELSQTINNQLI